MHDNLSPHPDLNPSLAGKGRARGRPTRRAFLAGTAAGLAAGGALGWLAGGSEGLRRLVGAPGPTPAVPPAGRAAELGMPGRYPGRVVEVYHPGSVRPDWSLDADAVGAMVDRGMRELTGADDAREAWRAFFQPDDVVAIKVNPVGRAPKPGESGRVPGAVGVISSPELLLKVVAALKEAGVPAGNILVFERYAEEFCDAGYDRVMTERVMDGVRWCASAVRYSDTQVDITGFDQGRGSCSPEMGRHVVGYDPDVFAVMGFAWDGKHDPRDDRRFRSHLSVVVSRMASKVITLPVLKDHRSSGVTLALKNLSHGMNNNVARSHLGGIAHGMPGGSGVHVMGANQCNTFIPTAVAQHPLRRKATLHILDGLLGVYEGGPGCWNRTWGVWPYRSLLFATDPVALDHVGWDILDAKRAREGWRPVGNMGLGYVPAGAAFSEGLSALGGGHPAGVAALAIAGETLRGGRGSEVFDRRTPEHVVLAGQLGLGTFEAGRIERRRVAMGADGKREVRS